MKRFIFTPSRRRQTAERKRKIQLGIREANKRALRNGIITHEKITVNNSNVVHNYWRKNTWRRYAVLHFVDAVVWRPKDQPDSDPIVLRIFNRTIPYEKSLLKTRENLIAIIVDRNRMIEHHIDSLRLEQKDNLTERLVAIVADDLRDDLYDELKRYVTFGSVKERYSLGMIANRGLLWPDHSIPDEVKLYISERQKFNPVEI